jgi:hypothetical protein
MSNSKNHLIYDILGVLRAGKISDDETVNQRLVSFWIDSARSIVIRQQINKRQSISNNIVQVINCMNMVQVDASECCDFETDCVILRTELQLPKVIETSQSDLINKVSPMSMVNKSYPFIPFERVPFWGNSLFNKHQTCSFLHNNYIYLYNAEDLIDKISVSGVFETPEDLKDYNNCDDQPCYNDDQPYPISLHMWPIMKKMIIDENFRFANMPSDDKNNADNDINKTKN